MMDVLTLWKMRGHYLEAQTPPLGAWKKWLAKWNYSTFANIQSEIKKLQTWIQSRLMRVTKMHL